MDALQSSIAQYIHCANEVVYFKLVHNVKELESDKGFFQPEMSHQIFGEKEQIFGYKNLRINIFYAANSLHVYVKITYDKKLDPKYAEGVEADNIMLKLRKALPRKFLENVDEFSSYLEKQTTYEPIGAHLNKYTRQDKDTSATVHFEIYKVDMTFLRFKEYHERMESFILWFIDAASYIDTDDEKWDFFTLYEKRYINGIRTFTFVGYATCYQFYAYPDKVRPRISQVLVLPPFQKQGHCAELISTIYLHYARDSSVIDIAAEDPSDNFQRVRDFVDAKNCMRLEAFSPENLHKGYSREMAEAAREQCKINKRQARRVYEILRLKNTREADEKQFNQFRQTVIERLNRPYKVASGRKKFLQEKFAPAAEERRQILQEGFEQCLAEYRRVVARLELC